MRRHVLTRRSGLTAAAATGLIALTTLAGTSAAAAPAAPTSVQHTVTTTIADVRLPAAPGSDHPVKVVMRYGSCSPDMVDL